MSEASTLYSCNFAGCGFLTTSKLNLKRHTQESHSGIESCPVHGCTNREHPLCTIAPPAKGGGQFLSVDVPFAPKKSEKGGGHSGVVEEGGGGSVRRRFTCSFPGCSYAATVRCNLLAHNRTHTGERPFPCSFPGCPYSATVRCNLIVHQRTHRIPEAPNLSCNRPGCKFTTNEASVLARHNKLKHKEGDPGSDLES